MTSTHPTETKLKIDGSKIPRGNLEGFFRYMQFDLVSGLLVFLIALPLCLGISLASGYPAIAGVFTAVVGSIITSFISNSELTIKGPAAGLIVIVVGAVTSFGYTGGQDPAADAQAYRMALAIGCVAGVSQIVFGVIRAGVLGDFFPTAVVHGMLAAIGVIIMLKQLPVAVGQSAKGEPFEILRELPEKFAHANPEIALIGGVSLLILFGLPIIKSWFRHPLVQMIPGPMVVLLVAVPMGMWFDLSHDHTYTWNQHEYPLGEQFLVNVPRNLINAMSHPDFSVFTNPALRLHAWTWVVMFSLIGTLESMLSAKAVDMLDPWKRKTDINRDLIAVGIANTAVSLIGGLPMISEIVRSKSNIDNGARTRFADLWHGIFLVGFVSLMPGLIHRIPLAALAAMLVYTGFRLASPREFINVYRTGPEQLIIFTVTILAVLATDLLIGIGVGILVKIAIHLYNGVPIHSVFRTYLDVEPQDNGTVVINAKESAVFTNWIPFKRQIEHLGLIQRNNVVVNLAGAKVVDHSVMEKLHELELDFSQAGLNLEVVGLEGHRQLSGHPHAARRRAFTRVRRVTITTSSAVQELITGKLGELGASGYTIIPCTGVGRRGLAEGTGPTESQVRIEVVAPSAVAESILDFIRLDVTQRTPVTACLETVEVLRGDQF